jgi:zinc transporter ZupT
MNILLNFSTPLAIEIDNIAEGMQMGLIDLRSDTFLEAKACLCQNFGI